VYCSSLGIDREPDASRGSRSLGRDRDPVKSGKLKYALVTLVPLAWLALITTTACLAEGDESNPKLGFFAAANDLAMKARFGALPPEKPPRCACSDN